MFFVFGVVDEDRSVQFVTHRWPRVFESERTVVEWDGISSLQLPRIAAAIKDLHVRRLRSAFARRWDFVFDDAEARGESESSLFVFEIRTEREPSECNFLRVSPEFPWRN